MLGQGEPTGRSHVPTPGSSVRTCVRGTRAQPLSTPFGRELLSRHPAACRESSVTVVGHGVVAPLALS